MWGSITNANFRCIEILLSNLLVQLGGAFRYSDAGDHVHASPNSALCRLFLLWALSRSLPSVAESWPC